MMQLVIVMQLLMQLLMQRHYLHAMKLVNGIRQ